MASSTGFFKPSPCTCALVSSAMRNHSALSARNSWSWVTYLYPCGGSCCSRYNNRLAHFSMTKKEATPAISYASARRCIAVRNFKSPVREHWANSCFLVTLIFPVASKEMLGVLFSARISCSLLVHAVSSMYLRLFSSHCCTALSTSWCDGFSCCVISNPGSLALIWLTLSTFSANGSTFVSVCSVRSTFCRRSCKHSAWLSKKRRRYFDIISPLGTWPKAFSRKSTRGFSSCAPGWYWLQKAYLAKVSSLPAPKHRLLALVCLPVLPSVEKLPCYPVPSGLDAAVLFLREWRTFISCWKFMDKIFSLWTLVYWVG